MGEMDLKHKVLAVVEEEGASGVGALPPSTKRPRELVANKFGSGNGAEFEGSLLRDANNAKNTHQS
jgi:hypothetical protein